MVASNLAIPEEFVVEPDASFLIPLASSTAVPRVSEQCSQEKLDFLCKIQGLLRRLLRNEAELEEATASSHYYYCSCWHQVQLLQQQLPVVGPLRLAAEVGLSP